MPDPATNAAPAVDSGEMLRAFRAYEHQQRIANTRVGCMLVITLMPAGTLLDYFVYHDKIWPFFYLRLAASAAAGIILAFLYSELGKRSVRWLGVVVPLIPVVSIAGMIAAKEGFASPYYAGLNLVLLAVGAVLHWTIIESCVAVVLVLLIYVGAGLYYAEIPPVGVLVNNFYFIALMDLIVVVGTWFAEKQRFREFALRFELDANRKKLEESNEKLVQLDEAKSRFFANISHELRTPLTLLLAPLENILARFGRSFDEETRQLLVTMQSNGMRLLKLINDLLDLVRLDSGVMQVRREPVAIEDFLRGLASAARQMAQDKHIKLEAIVEPGVGQVLVDRDKLEKIILNLQFNALKFTPAGGRVELRARVDDKELVLQVADTGMGISEKNLANIFGRFWQADDSSRRKFQGVGIGLSLVKELVEVQGGKVSVESKEGAGTTFTVRLPYLQPDPSAQPAETQQGAGLVPSPAPSAGAAAANGALPANVGNEEWITSLYRRAELFPSMTAVQDSVRPVESAVRNSQLPKAVIADDEPDMLRFLKSQLGSHYQIFEAVDGQQAIEKAAQFLPDIILLDMMMPEKDGLQACRELRERSTTQSIPIVLLTARADEETKLAALKAGASDFLPKPFSTTELHVRVKNLVESYHYQRKLAKQNRTLESTIEQLKETETQLVQTEKLASLGRLSAGIIHEINNPLNFATTGLYTLRNKAKHLTADQQADYAEILRDVEDGLDRVKIIVSDLRSFTHPDMESLDEVPVADIVTSSLRFVSHESRDRIVIQTHLTDGQIIRGNKNKLIQVLVNLLQNSFDALVKKTFTNGERPTIAITGRVEGGRSILIVRDNGSGIDPQIIDKIFDPFFTTKDVGEGMGLGLSISYRIVQDCDGHIAVRSEHGKNCEFTLEFPIPSPEPATATATAQA